MNSESFPDLFRTCIQSGEIFVTVPKIGIVNNNFITMNFIIGKILGGVGLSALFYPKIDIFFTYQVHVF